MRHINKLWARHGGPFHVTLYAHQDCCASLLLFSAILNTAVDNNNVLLARTDVFGSAANNLIHILRVSNEVAGKNESDYTTQHRYFDNAMTKIEGSQAPTMLYIDEWIGGDAARIHAFKAKHPGVFVGLFLTHPGLWSTRQYGSEIYGGLGEIEKRARARLGDPEAHRDELREIGHRLMETGHTEVVAPSHQQYRSNTEFGLIPGMPLKALTPLFKHDSEGAPAFVAD